MYIDIFNMVREGKNTYRNTILHNQLEHMF